MPVRRSGPAFPIGSTDDNGAFSRMPTSLPAEPESWVDLLRRNGWHTVSLGKLTHEPDGYRWDDSGTYDIGRSRATYPDMRHSWNEILYDHDKWGAQRYPLFAYADGTGRVRNVSAAWEIGTDGNGRSLPDEAYPDGQMAQAAIEKLREFSDDGTRFCLAVGFYKPHLPFNAPKAYWDLYDPRVLPDPSPLGKPVGANRLEYGAGTDALDPSSRPQSSVVIEDLSGSGFGNREPVFHFTAATDRDDLSLLPSTSTDLIGWSFEPLEFLDAEATGNSMRFRFRLTDGADPARFFRFDASSAPSFIESPEIPSS